MGDKDSSSQARTAIPPGLCAAVTFPAQASAVPGAPDTPPSFAFSRPRRAAQLHKVAELKVRPQRRHTGVGGCREYEKLSQTPRCPAGQFRGPYSRLLGPTGLRLDDAQQRPPQGGPRFWFFSLCCFSFLIPSLCFLGSPPTYTTCSHGSISGSVLGYPLGQEFFLLLNYKLCVPSQIRASRGRDPPFPEVTLLGSLLPCARRLSPSHTAGWRLFRRG